MVGGNEIKEIFVEIKENKIISWEVSKSEEVY